MRKAVLRKHNKMCIRDSGYYVVVRSIRKTIDDGSDKIRSF